MTTINSTSKSIPFADDQSIAKYNARWGSCSCPDYCIRGGSYRIDGQKVCKHMARQRSPQALVGPSRRKAFAELAAKNAELAELAKPSAEFVKLEAQNPSLDPASCDSDESLAWLSYLELQPESDFETFFYYEFH